MRLSLPAMLVVFLLFLVSLRAASDLRLVDAVQHRDTETVRSLLEQRVDVKETQADGATALHWAAHWDDLETVGRLIEAGADVNARNEYGVSPLSLACTNRSAAMVEKLLKAGANANAAEESGETVLMTCARTGSVEAVKLLLDHGADVNAKESRRSQTALMWAAGQRHADVVQALIRRGADVNARSQMTFAPTAVQFDSYAKEFDAHNRSKGGFTPLMFACRSGDLESARLLVEAGADLNVISPEHGSALVVAAASGREELAIYLAEKGADPNAADDYGMTAMHHAVVEGISAFGRNVYFFQANMPDLLKVLLAHGANPNARITKNYEFNSRPDFDLAKSMVDATPFLLAAASADVGIMRILSAAGANPLLTTEDDVTALMVLAELVTGELPGVVASKRGTSDEGHSILDAATLAIKLGVDVNAADKEGQTALHGAVSLGVDELVRLLVNSSANLGAKNKKGQTPLNIAEAEGGAEEYSAHDLKSTAKLLRDLGATE